MKVKGLRWIDKNTFSVDDNSFRVIESVSDMQRFKSMTEYFLLAKPRWKVEKYINILADRQIENIVEIGIFRGGSTVFFHSLLKPRRLIAIELNSTPVEVIENYMRKKNCYDQIKPYYGVDQADKKKMLAIMQSEFQQKDIDLVIDDGAHYLHETRSAFNAIFPYLKPGALYIIEDWRWTHAASLRVGNSFKYKPAMTSLLFEIIMACPSINGLIDEITIDRNSAYIQRGKKQLDPNTFDISKSYYLRNRIKINNPFLPTIKGNIQNFYNRALKILKR